MRDSRAVELDGASPESRLTSLSRLDLDVLSVKLGSGEVLGRSNGWMPRRADDGGGGATVILIGGLPATVPS